MCCIIDSFLSDLFTLVRQILASIRIQFNNRRGKRGPQSISGSRQVGGHGAEDAQQHEQLLTSTASGHHHHQHQLQQQSYTYLPSAEYKMMSKKGLLKFVKYTLIFSNAFGFVLSIFLGLFGIAYPDKHFPLSYKGREMALCSLFCMLFTTIGYCGAQNHRRILLIIYGATNVIIVIIVVILWFLFKENSILGNKEISNMFITTLAITIAVMFLFSFILAFHIQTFKDNTHDSIVSQSHQLLQQTTAFLQQQQQQQQHLQMQQQQQHLPHQQHQIQQQQQQQHGLIASSSGGNQTMGLPVAGPPHPAQLHLMSGHQQLQLAPPPLQMPPLGGQQTTIGSGSTKRNKAGPGVMTMQPPPPPPPQLHAQTLLPPPPPPQVPPSSNQASASNQQMVLMRNQSSPLPAPVGAGYIQQQSSSSRSSNKMSHQHHLQQQQHYQQAQKQQNPQNIIQSTPSPPPMPSMHHHSMREHHRIGLPVTNNRLPSCPVQYCTFQCDRTV